LEKQARSIRYQLTIAKLPLAKDVNAFTFKDTPINEGLSLSPYLCGPATRIRRGRNEDDHRRVGQGHDLPRRGEKLVQYVA
jgi:hypothetical protein